MIGNETQKKFQLKKNSHVKHFFKKLINKQFTGTTPRQSLCKMIAPFDKFRKFRQLKTKMQCKGKRKVCGQISEYTDSHYNRISIHLKFEELN